MTPTCIYLDTQQWTNCVEPRVAGWTADGLDHLRVGMLKKLKTGDVAFVGSHFHLEEMARIHPVARRPILDFFWSMVRWLVLRPTVELAKAEVEAGRALGSSERYVTFVHQQRLKQLSRNEPDFENLGKQVAATNKTRAAAQKQRRVQVELVTPVRFQGKTAEQATREWWSDPDAALKDWANDYLAKSKTHFDLPDDTSLWPDPVTLPTIRAIGVSSLARTYMQLAEHRRISEGDEHDSHHYAAASYADTFVCEDAAFQATLAKIPKNPVEVSTFGGFAEMMGVRPH